MQWWSLRTVSLAAGALLLAAGMGGPSSALAQACVPRPNVSVVTNAQPNGSLDVTLTAGTSATVPTNRLEEIRFNSFQAARVDAAGETGQTRSFAVTPNTTSFSFAVHPTTSGVAPTVHLVIKDACGAWPTFVGGRLLPAAPPPEKINTAPTPELDSIVLFGAGGLVLLGVAFLRRRRRTA